MKTNASTHSRPLALQELEDKLTRTHQLAWLFYTRHVTAHWLMEWAQLGEDVADEIRAARIRAAGVES